MPVRSVRHSTYARGLRTASLPAKVMTAKSEAIDSA